VGPYVLHDTLTTQPYRNLLDNFSPGLLEVVPLAEEEVTASELWGRSPAGVEQDLPKLDVEVQLHGFLNRWIYLW
jgi:hypothetical protein